MDDWVCHLQWERINENRRLFLQNAPASMGPTIRICFRGLITERLRCSRRPLQVEGKPRTFGFWPTTVSGILHACCCVLTYTSTGRQCCALRGRHVVKKQTRSRNTSTTIYSLWNESDTIYFGGNPTADLALFAIGQCSISCLHCLQFFSMLLFFP